MIIARKIFVSGMAMGLAGFVSTALGVSAPDASFIQAGNNFALDYYRQTASSETSNFCFSPLSLSEAFGMLYPGTKAQSASELASVFHFGADAGALVQNFGELNAWLQTQKEASGSDLNFSLANGIWIQRDFPFDQGYLDLVSTPFEASLQLANFVDDYETERSAINDWVSERTGERIKELFPADSIDSSTRLVLVNALYFKGGWAAKFWPNDTRLAPFFRGNGSVDYIPMMRADTYAGLYSDDQVTAVDYDFEGGKFSLLFLLPQPGNTLGNLESTLTAERLAQITTGLFEDRFYLYMPRFSIDTNIDLAPELDAMGVHDIFQSGIADLTGLSPLGNQLFVGAAVQKANITVNEYGVEAAAATGISGVLASVPPVLKIDRSCMYLLREKASGTILFVGRLEVPETSQSESERLELATRALRNRFSGTETADGWVAGTYLGDLYAGAYPWVFQTDLEWIYPVEPENYYDGFWFWRPSTGWHYTSYNWYPFSWRADDGSWYWKQVRIE